MRRIFLGIILSVYIPAAGTPPPDSPSTFEKDHAALFKRWAKLTTVAKGDPASIGEYQAGCIIGAVPLKSNAKTYAIMRPSRQRHYGHPILIQYIENLAQAVNKQKMPILLVGDMGPARGGPMRSGHASHQNGLDVDLWLQMSQKMPSPRQRESWGATSYVKGRKVLTRGWGQTQIKLTVAAADSPLVSRIFVSPAIKRHFCGTQPEAAWLYKLRAWWGHTDHLHVRLHCPPTDTNCKPQPALNPEDNGCGEELAWWFSKEADEEWLKIRQDKKPREFPDLPKECVSLSS